MVNVYAKYELSYDDLQKITDIRRESQCPNESLKNTFERFAGTDADGNIYFDAWNTQEYCYKVD